jgi:hypothetical protein
LQFESSGDVIDAHSSSRRARWVWIPAIFAGALCTQLWLERHGKSDSQGLWYSIYCATTYTVVIVFGAGAVLAFRRIQRK